uniref:CRAL-TRIO domain-containing protein n=1 Tax=Haemonchus contortus TaxID=6289 RepID=A0A7I5E9L1_HAECO|nr:Cellular retinaldehyde-binding triple function domain containing protein [Haemonchus contortus]
MTIHSSSRAADPISPAEQETIDVLRSRLNECMKKIPDDLDTDLNLVRWIRGHQGNLDKICTNFTQYVSSRKAAGFLGRDLPERYFEMPQIKPFLPFIASSRLADTVWSEEHNAFMFVERAWAQPKEFIKTFKASDYLIHCFGYSELLLQLMLERERKQSKDRGPVQFIVIFDLATVNITDYVNPLSGYMKLWQLRSELWQEWYPEVVQRIYLLNPPRLVSLLWKIARLFLNENNLRRMEIVGDNDMTKYMNSKFVPKEYGGDFVNKDMPGDESGVSIRRKITAADYYQAYQHYVVRGVQRPKPAKKDLLPGEHFTIPIIVPDGKSLLWDFVSSGEIEFYIYKDKDEQQLVYPRLRLITSKLPEEGTLPNLSGGEYSFVFVNHGSFFTTKLEYAITIA